MRYAEYAPAPRFAQLVERFWFLDGDAAGATDAIIPDGRVELIVHYGGAIWRHRHDAAPVRQPATLLVGQMYEPVILAPHGYTAVAAIRLRPAAARALLGVSMHEVTGQFVELESLFPSIRGVRDRLGEAQNDADRMRALEEWLWTMGWMSPLREIDGVVAAILQSGGRVSIDAVAFAAGVSLRQLERQFQQDVGLTPKAFSRIIRLQSALRRIREGQPLSDVAVACGYYDQAHMTRDFRQLAAMSPGGWQTHGGELAPLFVER
ncbi:MAG TPA: helix-turn-helix transcriptional regulator [Vicinamibacterales bacterium]|jgi:AraC-like DNA-binding protein